MLLVNFVYPSVAAPFVYYIFLPVVLLGGVMYLQHRKSNLLYCDVSDCSSPYEIECMLLFGFCHLHLFSKSSICS